MAAHLAELAWTEVPDRSVLVVPTGSCEQHGPHLPLDVDLRIASALAAAAAEGRHDVVVGPPLTIGASGEHQSFPGTLSIGTEALVTVVVELSRSALPPPGSGLPEPFAGVLFVNGHGGNVEAFATATARLRDEGRAVEVWHPRVPGGDSHAGRTETSLLLHLDPACVRADRLPVGSTARWREIGDVVRAEGLAAVTPNGVLGDATGATAEEGARVFEELLADLRGALARFADGVGTSPAPAPGS
ncbi:MAG TPA: mycofactocin biosynthesis peptidyl-dipeptidase MftE [Microthrixaceae bacterium]|nr:mycofactocin biosynthesis peptidyl-dipeptidase MftE [Microthrixaceae bacterium]